MARVLVITDIPSPYQVELFDALARHGLHSLQVAYLHETSANRSWKVSGLHHEHLFLNGKDLNNGAAKSQLTSADLVIFNYYQNSQLLRLLKVRVKTGKPWCFWGERPGYHGFDRLGTLYRKWRLAALHDSPISIWGIGEWAVKRYRLEFGSSRKYFNVPYYSNLNRFAPIQNKSGYRDNVLKFLYSGSLNYRKGVDLLALAFCRLADEFPIVQLDLVGEGPMHPKLERMLRKHQNRVHFLGFRSWEELPGYYWRADLLCVPSRYDGWGLVVPEGLAAGLPVISTDRTGAALEFINQKNGWLISAGNEWSLYQAMRNAVLLSSDQRLKRSSAARLTVSKHNLSDGVKRFHSAINGTLDSYCGDSSATKDYLETGDVVSSLCSQ